MARKIDSNEQAAQCEVFLAEVAYYFPDPADLFDDVLARMLGLVRPSGISDAEWRLMRVAYIEERDTEAERLQIRAGEATNQLLEERANQSLSWAVGDDVHLEL